ncbi:HAMP domain-containing sensor histidine kinase [Saccharothrix longispora]|uniref:histidine kinase n=1 Tax=Saccharothrix longispora TaxID=33920 RepID=A0ABU1PS77_9PSEU|nr:HAMP domain-containing sensor histidine kinase [Saccharothrix longispora]MDR6593498.1 signal transduction histidine kinase [Saccharothrix longispora]
MTRLAARALVRACGALAVPLVLLTVVLTVWHERGLVRERDRHDAALVAEVLTVSTDPDVLRAAVSRTEAGRSGRVEVRLPGGGVLGVRVDGPATVLAVRAAGGGEASVSLTPSPVPVPFATAALVLVLAAVCAAGAVLLGLRPLRPLAGALALITEVAGRDGGRVRVDGPRELVALAEAVNANADRTEHLLAKEREMIADVSHRLRTPLTALRLDADAIGTGAAADRVRASVEALGRDVDRIIHSLRPVAPVTTAPTCDLVTAVTERMVFWSAHAETQGRPCEVSLPDGPTPVPLSRDRLDAVVDALLANVFQHTPPAAPVCVEVVRHAGWVTLVVEDGGPGFADPGRALRRGASGSGSTGLGLDIARSTVEATGGHVVADRGRLGGARVRLRLCGIGREHSPEDPRAWRLWKDGRTRATG